MISADTLRYPESGGNLRDYLPAAALLFGGLLALAGSWLLSGSQSGQYLVVTAPTSSLAQSIDLVTETGGRVAATGGFANIVIAGSNRPDFTASMRKAGAWLAISVPAIAGCGNSQSQEQTK